MGVAAPALDLQPLALHRRQMRAARDERHVGAGLGQRRTKPASDAAGAYNRNPHGFSSWRIAVIGAGGVGGAYNRNPHGFSSWRLEPSIGPRGGKSMRIAVI